MLSPSKSTACRAIYEFIASLKDNVEWFYMFIIWVEFKGMLNYEPSGWGKTEQRNASVSIPQVNFEI
jgi:hypothetical protein